MLEMLKERKAALEAQGKKGFTLMEMLIVIAIIAILIAIAIPVFTSQLTAANDAADEANGRSLYAALQADYMLDNLGAVDQSDDKAIKYNGTTYKFNNGASVTVPTDGAPTVEVTLSNGPITFPMSS